MHGIPDSPHNPTRPRYHHDVMSHVGANKYFSDGIAAAIAESDVFSGLGMYGQSGQSARSCLWKRRDRGDLSGG